MGMSFLLATCVAPVVPNSASEQWLDPDTIRAAVAARLAAAYGEDPDLAYGSAPGEIMDILDEASESESEPDYERLTDACMAWLTSDILSDSFRQDFAVLFLSSGPTPKAVAHLVTGGTSYGDEPTESFGWINWFGCIEMFDSVHETA